ncbi:MAG: glycoside hydrolase family 28 protein [Verrucomicrobiota bacterium]
MQFSVDDFGAAGDGASLDSRAFQKAISTCRNAGGGTVVVPPGRYLVGPLELCGNLQLHFQPGAVLIISDEIDAFPIVETRWAGFVCHALQPCIFGDGLENVSITGHGIIDGQGARWWEEYGRIKNGEPSAPAYSFEEKLRELNEDIDTSGAVWDEWNRQFLRPPLLQLKDCKRVSLDGVTLRNSPFWNTHILFCEDVTVHNVRFENPANAPNGDGLDIDSSCRVRVSNCSFNVNDDCLCLKSGIDANGRAVGRPTEDVVITNCTMYRGHGGVVMGSDTAGGIRNVAISNCIFNGTDRGIRIKSRRGRGGVVEDIRAQNIIMTNVLSPIVMNLYYTCGATGKTAEYVGNPEPQAVDEGTPAIRRIHLSNITARKASVSAGALIGLPESPIAEVSLADISIDTVAGETPTKAAMSFQCPPSSGAGLLAVHTAGLNLRNVNIDAKEGPDLQIRESSDSRVDGQCH